MKKIVFLTLVLSFVFTAKAQPPARILFNSSFEEPVIANNSFAFINENLVPGWQVDIGNVVEFWRKVPGPTGQGFNQVLPQDGEQHIELNAQSRSDVFLDVCLLNNETVTLIFHHRARRGNDATINTMAVSVDNLVPGNAGTVVVQNNANLTATNVNDTNGNTWTGVGNINTVTANSFRASSPVQGWTRYQADITNTGASGNCRITFAAVEPGGTASVGNFIDNVQIGGLNPLTEFSSNTYSDDEGIGGNLPVIIINGRVDTPLPGDPPSTVQIDLNNPLGNATPPSDYNLVTAFAAANPAVYSYNAATRILTVTIAPGDYNGTAAQGIPIPLGIVNDNVPEANETIILRLIAGTETGNIRVADADCNTTEILTPTYTIIDDDIVLPVTFTNWKLDDRECGIVKLNWATTQELNSNYFEIQFSENGNEWKTIEKVTAKGTTNRTNEYSFVHQTDYKSGYYRLKQVDFDGQFILTHVISSTQDCDKESNYFKFYPNPKSSNQDLTLEFYSTSTSLDYTIIDALGREVKTNRISTTSNQFIKQNISENLTKGLYLIKFSQEGKEIHQTKLIVR